MIIRRQPIWCPCLLIFIKFPAVAAVQISTPSNSSSLNSKPYCERPPPEPSKPSSQQSPKPSPKSVHKSAKTTSQTKAIAANHESALAPGSADAATFACFVLASSGYPKEALRQIERAIKLSPNYPASYLGHLGNAYRLTGKIEEARHRYLRSQALPLTSCTKY
jgi:tetratricopeptide (TPR) repeat protein